MADFAGWLAKQDRPDDPGMQSLKDFARQHSADWPYPENDIASYVSIISERAPDAVRSPLLIALFRSYQEWQQLSPPAQASGTKSTLRDFLTPENLTIVGLALFGIFVIGSIVYGIFRGNLLNTLSSDEHARGLITFLFAFSTIAIFLLIAIATFWMEKEEVKERFGSAKDLLTIVIGIMGTILGFYYGSAGRPPSSSTTDRPGNIGASSSNQNTAAQLRLESLSAGAVAPGGTSTITATVRGGTAPYIYSMTFDAPADILAAAALRKLENRRSSGDTISEQIQVPAGAGAIIKTEVAVKVHLAVKDDKGATDQREATLTLRP